MDLQYFRKLMGIFDESKAETLEIEEEGIKIKVSKQAQGEASGNNHGTIIQMGGGGGYTQSPVQTPVFANNTGNIPQPIQQSGTTEEVKQAPAVEEVKSSKSYEIRSPIVGTFYRSPSPDSDAFVEIGSRVSPGSTLCIVEAMKLMNEIESDASGIIEKINVESGSPVEFNQVLFTIKLD